jgi:hypothetical protein
VFARCTAYLRTADGRAGTGARRSADDDQDKGCRRAADALPRHQLCVLSLSRARAVASASHARLFPVVLAGDFNANPNGKAVATPTQACICCSRPEGGGGDRGPRSGASRRRSTRSRARTLRGRQPPASPWTAASTSTTSSPRATTFRRRSHVRCGLLVCFASGSLWMG